MKPRQRLIVFTSVLMILALACSLSPQPTQAPVDQGAIDTMVAATIAAQEQPDQPNPVDPNPTADNNQQPTVEDQPDAVAPRAGAKLRRNPRGNM